MPQQNPYGQNPLLQQVPQPKGFKVPTGLFWAILIAILGVAVWLIFF